MTLKSDAFSSEFPELRITFMDESFEVDGILYTPPWKRDLETTDLSVHYSPMFDLKEEYYFEEGF